MVNYRGKLQELCQKKGVDLPKYEYVNTASDNEPIWLSTCTALGLTTEATGKTIKSANSNAAEILLQNVSEKTIEHCDIPTNQHRPAHLICAFTTNGNEYSFIDIKFINIQNCLDELWSQGDTIDWFNFDKKNLSDDCGVSFNKEYSYDGAWVSAYINDLELLFWCPDDKNPTKKSSIIIG